TPILGVLGIIEDAECALGSAFRNEGDAIVLLDAAVASGAKAQEHSEGVMSDLKVRPPENQNVPSATRAAAAASQTARLKPCPDETASSGELTREFSSSEYAKVIQGVVAGEPPTIDLDAEKRLIDCLVDLAGEKAILSAHDVSDGGLAVTLAESCFGSDGLSAEVKITSEESAEYALFGERGTRAVVSASPALLARVNAIAAQYNVSASRIGTVTRGEFRIECGSAQPGVAVPQAAVIRGEIDSFRKPWAESLSNALES
ncbi:MAG TPA: AIR synthase-related protein, partial [Candidatus Acidoferrales bacterium]|nr:AIR synthase-related protein [Candidatus Acidoferrales bacterium]